MPINQSQKNFIDTSIGFMFDFSSKAELVAEARLITEAIGTEVSESHRYYYLSQCVFHPERRLNRLHENGDITVSELKAYLIDYIIEKLQTNARQYEYVFIPPDCNKESLKRLHCPQTEASNQVFHSNAVVIEHRLPWTLPALSGRVYTQELLMEDIINDESGIIRQPRVKVTVNLPDQPPVTKIIDLFLYHFFRKICVKMIMKLMTSFAIFQYLKPKKRPENSPWNKYIRLSMRKRKRLMLLEPRRK